MNEPLRLLVVEDSEDDAALLLRELKRAGFDVTHRRVDTAAAMREALANEVWDAVTCDCVMPGFSGGEALATLRGTGLDLPFVIVSGKIDDEVAVEMLKAGAHDFVPKGRLARLSPALRRELRDAQTRREHRLAQSMLEQSEERFRTFARISPVGIYYTDAEGACLYVNETWCAFAGMAAEQALGRGCEAALHPADREAVVQRWHASVREGREFQAEYRFLRPDGTTLWLLGRAVPERAAEGTIVAWVGAITDITERKRAEQAMEEQLDELRRFQQVAVDRELRMAELEAELARLGGARTG